MNLRHFVKRIAHLTEKFDLIVEWVIQILYTPLTNQDSEMLDRTSLMIRLWQPNQTAIPVTVYDIVHHHRDTCQVRVHVRQVIQDLKQ